MKTDKLPKGFTLTELLVTVTLICVLAFLVLSGAGRITAAAKKTGCVNHLRQIFGYIGAYAADHNGKWPYAVQLNSQGKLIDPTTYSFNRNFEEKNGTKSNISVVGFIAPYVIPKSPGSVPGRNCQRLASWNWLSDGGI